jgi:hypothetical protein
VELVSNISETVPTIISNFSNLKMDTTASCDTLASLPDPEEYVIFTVAAMLTSDLNGYDP